MNNSPFLAGLGWVLALVCLTTEHTEVGQQGKNFDAKADKNGADLKCYFCSDGGHTDLFEA